MNRVKREAGILTRLEDLEKKFAALEKELKVFKSAKKKPNTSKPETPVSDNSEVL